MAAVYFTQDAGRGGASGFLASDLTPNEFLASPALKTLAGYPLTGVAPAVQGRLHATTPANVLFTPVYGRAYATTAIHSYGGASGGPLFVQYNDAYYPAAIYLGGSGQSVVRALDSAAVELFGLAELSGVTTPVEGPGGALALTGTTVIDAPAAGSVRMFIEPEAARQAGGGWRISTGTDYLPAGWQEDGLAPDTYTLELAAIPGFKAPARHEVVVTVGRLATYTFTYETADPGEPARIVTPPIARRTIGYGATTTLTVEATGRPEPAYQWYRGTSGDTSSPVAGATGASFTTPALTAGALYWVRVSNPTGAQDSPTSEIRLAQPIDARLAGLSLSAGALSPAFTAETTVYAAEVADTMTNVRVTPTLSDLGASVTINGQPAVSGQPGAALALLPGENTLAVAVTARDGVTTRTYTVTVRRAAPVALTTLAATDVGVSSARLRGTVTPHGPALVFFEYGPTTLYGNTTAEQPVSGSTPLTVGAALAGLVEDTTWHYRIVARSAAGLTHGADLTFLTQSRPPLVATGSAVSGPGGEITLTGAVHPLNAAATVQFEYGPTTAYGTTTTAQAIAAGDAVRHVSAVVTGLPAGRTYHFRLVGSNTAGTARGDNVSFVVGAPTEGDGVPDAAPTVVTGGAIDIGAAAAILNATVTPHDGTTLAWFEYGPTTAYGSRITAIGLGNGLTALLLSQPVTGLRPGTRYHFRAVAANGLGTRTGADATFITLAAPPTAETGEAVALSPTSVELHGAVLPGGATTQVFFDYGVDPLAFSHSVAATPSPVTGEAATPVRATIEGLAPAATYYYRVRAVNSGGSGTGEARPLQPALLEGLRQQFPDAMAEEDRRQQLTITLTPEGIGGWRFTGEQEWRVSGVPATGLATGDRLVEFKPVAGHVQPEPESVSHVAGEPPVALERAYEPTGEAGTGTLTVTLKPPTVAAGQGRWRLLGEGDAAWLASGAPLSSLRPGAYLVEAQSVAGRITPAPQAVVVAQGGATTLTMTYFEGTAPTTGTLPASVPIETVSGNEALPYAWVGQVRGPVRSGSGVVVKPRVVATAGHVVFDESTLTAVPDLQWLFQRDLDVHEPVPLRPRGYYLLSGYADRREAAAPPAGAALYRVLVTGP